MQWSACTKYVRGVRIITPELVYTFYKQELRERGLGKMEECRNMVSKFEERMDHIGC